MSKLVEKMAREIAVDAGEAWDHLPEDLQSFRAPISKACYRSMARAALAVVMAEMREPSLEMYYATQDNAGSCLSQRATTQIWQALLTQFEKEQTGG